MSFYDDPKEWRETNIHGRASMFVEHMAIFGRIIGFNQEKRRCKIMRLFFRCRVYIFWYTQEKENDLKLKTVH